MPTIKIGQFAGMLPAIDENLLPDTAAVYAENVFLYSGALRPMPKPKILHTLVNPNAGFVYRIPKSYTDADNLYGSKWLEFTSPDTNVIRSQVFQDVHDRYYFFSDSGPPRYTTKARIDAGDPSFILGINPPLVPPGVVATGGTEPIHSRTYVYTWVSAYSEESAPSPPTNVNEKKDASYAVTCTAPPLSDQGTDRNLTKIRLYRTVTSTAGVATYFFVAELPIANPTVTFTDNADDADISFNEEMVSTFYNPPPATLVGAVTMPNGMVAGWSGTNIWFCEPYRMHAWPVKYGQTVEYPIVGLGVLGQSLVVATSGYPSVATGTHPSLISMAMLTIFEPCLSRGSILSTPEGVYYASPSGLQLVSPGSLVNITREAATKDKWQRLTALSKLRAARLGTIYFAYGAAQIGVFEETAFQTTHPTDPALIPFEVEDFTGAHVGVMVDPAAANVGIVQLRSVEAVINVETDPWSGELFIIKDGKVYWLDVVDLDTSLETAYWTSKVFQTNQVRNFGALRLYFDLLSGSPPGDLGRVKVLADGHVVAMDRPLVKSGQLMRPSSGWKADFWQVLLTSKVRIKSVQMANSVKELNSV